MTLIAFVVLAIIVFLVNPPPTTVIGYFTLFQKNTLLGLLALDLMYLLSQILMGLILLALCVALRRASPFVMAFATILGFVGIVLYFASNTAFSMLSLSSQYSAATTDAQRSVLLAAGKAALTGLAVTQGPGGIRPQCYCRCAHLGGHAA